MNHDLGSGLLTVAAILCRVDLAIYYAETLHHPGQRNPPETIHFPISFYDISVANAECFCNNYKLICLYKLNTLYVKSLSVTLSSCKGEQFPQIAVASAFLVDMLGTHDSRPQLREKCKFPTISCRFRFRIPREENRKIRVFSYFRS